jgi:hypothetical protein
VEEKIMKQLGLGIIVAIGLTLPAFGQEAVNAEEGSVWVLNPTKSTFRGPISKTQAFYVGKETYTVAGFLANGTSFSVTYPASDDGKSRPISGAPNVDAQTVTRLDPYTIKTVRTKDGKVVQTLIAIYNPDGKTTTVTVIGATPAGVSYNSVLVFEKQ